MNITQQELNKFTYTQLGADFYSPAKIQAINEYKLALFNQPLFQSLFNILSPTSYSTWVKNLLNLNNKNNNHFIAMAYAGHQFGHFTMLGDGRACLLAEHKTNNGKLFDLHLKGSGQTVYSRSGDGNATLAPMMREYLISEAMHYLKIPTTRSLAIITTGNQVYRNSIEMGAMLIRQASSHLRIGTFEYAARINDSKGLNRLLDYASKRHYPEVINNNNLALSFLEKVINQQIELICHWQRVGFIHGVMNTDNTTISGETIDYGPCAFMDEYHPNTVFSSIDENGRYAFSNQPKILFWNLSRLAETLLPVIDQNTTLAIEKAQKVLDSGLLNCKKLMTDMMANKIGFDSADDEIMLLTDELLTIMQQNNLDYTNTFLNLRNFLLKEKACLSDQLFSWARNWREKILAQSSIISSTNLMAKVNPVIIPRNHLVEEALNNLTQNQCSKSLTTLLNRVTEPYTEKEGDTYYQTPPTEAQRVLYTYCGT